MAPHEQHTPPPLSHHPYAYPSSRYAFNSYPPGSNPYPPSTPSSQYSHGAYYNDVRNMEIEPREEMPAPLHHLPHSVPPMMSDHPMPLDCVPHVSTNCEQGNSRVVISSY